MYISIRYSEIVAQYKNYFSFDEYRYDDNGYLINPDRHHAFTYHHYDGKYVFFFLLPEILEWLHKNIVGAFTLIECMDLHMDGDGSTVFISGISFEKASDFIKFKLRFE